MIFGFFHSHMKPDSFLCSVQKRSQHFCTLMYSVYFSLFLACLVQCCVAVCCSVLLCVAVCCSVLQCVAACFAVCCRVLYCVAMCCTVLQCACFSVLDSCVPPYLLTT